jgi:uncharacterized membrane protein
MKTKLLKLWDSLRATFWLVPTLMAIMAIGLSFAMVALDEAVGNRVLEKVGWVWAGGPEGARGLLSTVAGSMITVAGVVFSITIVALSLASSQYGPRLLRNFVRDKGNQIVLGSFIATFVYCLLVLRTVRGGDGAHFVPAIAITLGMVLTLASLGVLIYFIHHVSISIQAATIIGLVSHELNEVIERLFPEKIAEKTPETTELPQDVHLPAAIAREARQAIAAGTGYLQAIDYDALMDIATEGELLLQVKHRPGHFVIRGSTLVMVWPGACMDERLSAKMNVAFILGKERTLIQDIEFAVDQLVEVAVRALSPGTNDPFTAMRCIDRLAEALCQLAERRFPPPYQYDDHGKLRVIAYPIAFADVTDVAFNQIRQYGRTSVAVTIRLLEVIAHIATRVQRQDDRAALLRHAIMVERGSQDGLSEEWDRRDVQERYQAALRALEQGRDHATQHGSPG